VDFDAPPGYTTLDGLRQAIRGAISVRATRVRSTVALWPELELWVRVVEEGDEDEEPHERPIQGATVECVYLDPQFAYWGHPVHVLAPKTNEEGWTRIRGVPRVEGLPVTVVVDADEDDGHGQLTVSEPRMELTIPLGTDPNEHPEPPNAIGIVRGRANPGGTIDLAVLTRDGRPAAHARVRDLWHDILSERTDAGGRLRIEHVRPGKNTLWLVEPGFVPTRLDVTVPPDGLVRATLREEEGWTLRVRTVDAEGRSLAYRPITVRQTESKAAYALLEGTVQIIPLLTGPDGWLDLPNLGHEAVEVEVQIAGAALAKAAVPYPGTNSAEVVLRCVAETD
jgi:hypothetical protein